MEAAAELVVDAAVAHAVERALRARRERASSPSRTPRREEHVEAHRVRELRARAEAAVLVVEARRRACVAALREQRRWPDLAGLAASGLRDLADGLARSPCACRSTSPRRVAVRVGDGLEDAAENPASRGDRRAGNTCPRRTGLLLGREEDRERPAAAAAEELHGELVDLVEIRALFAIDLHAHEELVHAPRDVLVLEGLALHHVAPVAGRVADAEEDGLVLGPRAAQRLVAPGIPVDRIVRVLQQVRRGFLREAVRHPPTLVPTAAEPSSGSASRQAAVISTRRSLRPMNR